MGERRDALNHGVTQFERKHVDALREMRAAARQAAAFAVPKAAGNSNAWVRGAIDVDAMLRAFPGVSIDPRFRLDSFVRADDIGCEGRIVAVSADSPLFEYPDSDSAAVGAALVTEPSAWNYLCLSVLVRELIEAGGRGAYRKWGKHEIARSNPWDRLSVDRKRQTERFVTQAQYWFLRTPDDVRPRVAVEERGVTVVFYSMRRVRHMPVYEHRDRYRRFHPTAVSFVADPGRELIGRVPVDRSQDWLGDLEDPGL